MTARALLVGPTGKGGEDVYVRSLAGAPPAGYTYTRAGDFHSGAPGVRCDVRREILLNQVVRRAAVPDMGFRALTLREPFDVVHVHAHPARLRGLGGAPLVMSEGSSSVVYLCDYLGWDEDRLRRRLRRAKRLYRALGVADRLLAQERATCVYVFSEWARALNLRWGADPDKLEVLEPGFSTPDLLPENAERETFTFLFAGGDFERKGGFELVEAFAAVARERPETRLVLAGSDPAQRNPDRAIHGWVPAERRARVLELLAGLEREGRAQVIPWVQRPRLVGEIFPAADAFVMPSRAEGFGFTNVEAMSHGLPVVTSTVGPASEIVAPGITGLLVAPGDTGALANAMLRLASDRPEARAMGAAGRARFLERFTAQRMRERLGDLYRRAQERAS